MKKIKCFFSKHTWEYFNNFLCEKEQCKYCFKLKWIRTKLIRETFEDSK